VISFPQLDREVRELLARAGFDPSKAKVRLSRELDEEHQRNRRRYAWMSEDPPFFEFAHATLDLDLAHRRGLLAHEVGHLIAITRHGDTSEDGADAAARDVLGVTIGYDHKWPGKGLQVSMADLDEKTRQRIQLGMLQQRRSAAARARGLMR